MAAAASMLYNRSDIRWQQQNISKSDAPVCVSLVFFVHRLLSRNDHISH